MRVCPPMLVKPPPAKILPSACTAIELTKSLAFGLKAVSSVPSVFKRAMLLRVTPRTLLKEPPIIILPSGCTAVARTWLPTVLRSSVWSSPPSVSSRAMKLRACPSMKLKKPPAKILPSACTAIELTTLFAFGSNESAAPVVASSRAM